MWYKKLTIVIPFFIFFALSAHKPTFSSRSLITKNQSQNVKLWFLESSHGFYYVDAKKPTKKRRIKASIINITCTQNSLLFNGKKSLMTDVLITPCRGSISFNGNVYTGSLRVRCDNNTVSLINYDLSISFNDIVEKTNLAADSGVKKEIASTIKIASGMPSNSYKVRVLLDERDFPHDNPWKIASCHGFVVIDPKNPDQQLLYKGTELLINEKDGSLYINGKKFLKQQAYIIPQKGTITFDNKQYQGGFLVTRDKGKTLLINSLDMEEYIYSVVYSEGFPSWPLEINKVFAIASRTYAIAMVQRAKTSKLPYHIKNTNAHQTYKGVHDSLVCRQVVDQTKGIFIAYKGKPALAMYDICCGGIIPAKVQGFDFSQAPYLKRNYACTHCKPCSLYRWESHYSPQALTKLAQREIPQLKTIKHITITKKDGAGLVREITLHDGYKKYTITGKKAYSLFQPKNKSFCYSVTKQGETISFNGRGYGHHMGLCQWGAREMVRKGSLYPEILNFYYPGTTLMRLS